MASVTSEMSTRRPLGFLLADFGGRENTAHGVLAQLTRDANFVPRSSQMGQSIPLSKCGRNVHIEPAKDARRVHVDLTQSLCEFVNLRV